MSKKLTGTEGVDYITCNICGGRFTFLGSHLTRTHNMTKDQYLKLYPSSLLICEVSERQRSKAQSGENNPMYGKKGKDNPNFGQKRPEQAKKMTGRHPSEATIEKMCGERVDRIMKICPICGTEFPVLPCADDRIYCSNKCVGVSNRGDNNPAKQPGVGAKISVTLTGHKVTQQQKEKQSRSMKGKLAGDKNPASRPEVAKKISESLIGHEVTEVTRQKIRENMPDGSMENNGNWRGGLSFENYPKEFFNQRVYIREKYNNCDYFTGIHKDICNGGEETSIHHIDYDKQNNHEDNLVPLSRKNHALTLGKRLFWYRLIKYTQQYDKEYYKEDKEFNIFLEVNN